MSVRFLMQKEKIMAAATAKDFTTTLATSLLSVVIAMIGFWLVEAKNYVTREDVTKMMENQSPYIRDKNLIMARIDEARQSNKDLELAVKNTNDALVQLKVELAVLNKTLQNVKTEQGRVWLPQSHGSSSLTTND